MEMSTFTSRVAPCNTPLSGETICCLVMILVESRDSGRDSGVDARAKLAVLSPCHERSLGQCRGRGPRFDIRADNGRLFPCIRRLLASLVEGSCTMARCMPRNKRASKKAIRSWAFLQVCLTGTCQENV